MATTKTVKVKDLNFIAYTSFPEVVILTDVQNSSFERDIHKEEAIELISLFIEHFDMTLTDIILQNKESIMKVSNNLILMFNDLENEIHDIAKSKGWSHEDDESKAVVLMHCELSEVIEWDRIGNPKSDHIPEFSGIEEEYADVIIRILDRAKFKDYNIGGAITAKIEFNKGREHKHGGKKY